MTARRIPIIPTIVVVAAAATMVALGVWQLGRADEKEALLAQYTANAAGDTEEIPRNLDFRRADSWERVLYVDLAIPCIEKGEWRSVAGRSAVGQSGYVHMVACQDNDPYGFAVYGVIGWSAGPQRPEWEGDIIQGVVGPARDGYKVVSREGLAGLEAAAAPDPNNVPNNHLAYAGQWFFFALTALLIYGFALRRRWRDQA